MKEYKQDSKLKNIYTEDSKFLQEYTQDSKLKNIYTEDSKFLQEYTQDSNFYKNIHKM